MVSSLAGFGVQEGTGREDTEQVARRLILGPLMEFQFGCTLISLNHLCVPRHFNPHCLPSVRSTVSPWDRPEVVTTEGNGMPGGQEASM